MKYLLSIVCLGVLFSSCKKENITFEPVNTDTTIITPEDTVTFLQQDIYTVNVYDNKRAKSLILLSPFKFAMANTNGKLMIFDENGRLLQEKTTPDGTALCFRRWVINGKVRYTYLTNYANVGYQIGYAVIADENLNEIKRVHLHNHNDIVYQNGVTDLDVHDFILLSDDHYIVCSYYPKPVSNIPAHLNPHPNIKVQSTIIQEIKNGVVVWQWDATEHPNLYEASIEGNNFGDTTRSQDYLHINSMFIDPSDDNLICSFRNLDQVLKIERGTGRIVWSLGGKSSSFPMSNTQYFMRQHDATFINNGRTLMLIDNGDAVTRPYSRIVEYDLDQNGKSINGFRAFSIPAPFARYMGSVQKFGDKYFIGGGSGNFALEIDSKTNQRSIEFTSQQASYRAYKYEL